MLKNFLNSPTKSITAAAIIIGSASLVSRILGLLRDRVLASQFGAGIELDMYYAAFRIPDLVFNLLILGALSAGFIPVFTSYMRIRKRAWHLVSVLLNVMLLGLILISLLMIMLAPWIMKIIAPGFSVAEMEITTQLTRIMFLSPIFLGISGILGGILQSFRRFFVYALAPIMYNIGIIAGALYFVPVVGIYGLAWGVALGAALHMLIQLPAVYLLGYRHTWVFDLTTPGLKKMFQIMVPRTLSLVVSQINLLVITIIGSTLAVGTITIFNLANNLQSLPLGLFGIPFAIAAFPTLTRLVKKKSKFIETFSATFRQILFLILPAMGLLIVLRAQIVRAVLGAGLFGWEDTVLTLQALSIFAISLFAQALVLLLARAFYAYEDSKTPFYTGLLSAFANIILALMLVDQFGVLGLVLAYSLASILNFILLFLLLHYKLGKIDGQRIILSTTKMLVASFMLALVAWSAKFLIAPISGTDTLFGIIVQALVSASAGLIAYLLVSWALRSEELYSFTSSLKRKLLRKTDAPIEIVDTD